MSDKTFYNLFISFIVGVGFYTAQGASRMLLLFLVLVFYFYLYNKQKIFHQILFSVVIISLGFLYSYLREPIKPILNTDVVLIEGKIITIPEYSNGKYEYVLKSKNFNVLLNENTYANRDYGSRAKIAFEPVELNSKTNKNYEKYLLAQKITVKGRVVSFEKIKDPNLLYRTLNNIRSYIQNTFNKFMTYPESGLASGLIIGNKSWMDSGLYNDFIKSGTIHIVALSGYNISVLVSLLRDSLIYVLPIIAIEYLLIVFIVLFLIMTGLSTTGLRAGIMALVIILSRNYGLFAKKDRLLILAGTILVVWRPYSLWYDLSYQLSIIATFSVLFLAPIVEVKYFRKFKNFWSDILATTVSATIFTAPMILYTVGSVSVVSFFANIIIGPLIPIATGFNIALILAGFIAPIGYVLGGLASFLHTIILFIAHFFAQLPFAQAEFQLPKIILVLIYTIFIWWVIKEYKKIH